MDDNRLMESEREAELEALRRRVRELEARVELDARGPARDPEAAELEAIVVEELVRESDLAMSVVDADGTLRWVNAAFARLAETAPEDCIGRCAFDLVHEDDRARTERAFRRRVRERGPFSFEIRLVGRSGRVVEMLWTVHPVRRDGKLAGFASSAERISERKRWERALRSSEARHRAILASVLDPTITIDAIGTIQSASDSMREVFGYEPGDLVGRNIKLLMPEPHHSAHDGYLENYRRTGHTNILGRTREFEVVRADGQTIWCELSVSRADIPGESQPLFTGSFRDVTERKEVQRALQDSERRFRAIFDQEYQYVGLLDAEGCVLEMNSAALHAGGIELDDVRGRPFCEVPWWRCSGAVAERVRDAVQRAAQGEFVRFQMEVEVDGRSPRTLDFSLKPIRDEEGRVVLLLPEGRDVTQLQQALQAEKTMLRSLAQLGESASILAHEIKNPITGINVALRAVAKQLGEDEKEVLEDLVARMQRLERMLRRTLSFATPLDVHREPTDLRALLARVLAENRLAVVKLGARADVRAPEEGLVVPVAPHMIEEVVANLLRNALDAIEPGGRVTLSAERTDDARARITVDDDGPGIAPSVRETLFRPFVTTKSTGTGLGLAICKKVVEAHGGTLAVTDAPEGGARFEILLPL